MSQFARPEMTAISAPRRYRIRHASAYRYGSPIVLAHHLLHLTPRSAAAQALRSFRMTIDPAPSVRAEHVDYFGNPTTYLELHDPHPRLNVVTEMEIEVSPPEAMPDTPWEEIRDALTDPSESGARAANAFAFSSPMIAIDPGLADYALASFTPGRGIQAAALDLTNRIYDDFIFDSTATTIATPVAEVFANRRGVCQDFAHLMVGCLRAIGLAARYVSGYLRTIPPPGREKVQGGGRLACLVVGLGSAATAGSTTIRPTGGRDRPTSSPSPGAATTAMSARCTASSSAATRNC